MMTILIENSVAKDAFNTVFPGELEVHLQCKYSSHLAQFQLVW